MNVLLEANKVSKIYNYHHDNEVKALDNISFTIYENDFICVMGPSGSGKSTLLNVLSTLDQDIFGSVKIHEREIKKMSEIEITEFRSHHLGYVFQDYQLLDEISIMDNILLPLAVRNEKEAIAMQQCKKIAEKLNISMILNKLPKECSGGQCQRGAIARALVSQPDLIVMDEPTGNLDSNNSHEIMSMIRQINDVDGNTILMVSHDSAMASYAKKVVFIRDGKIDAVLHRADKKQQTFFQEIVSENSKESFKTFQTN